MVVSERFIASVFVGVRPRFEGRGRHVAVVEVEIDLWGEGIADGRVAYFDVRPQTAEGQVVGKVGFGEQRIRFASEDVARWTDCIRH